MTHLDLYIAILLEERLLDAHQAWIDEKRSQTTSEHLHLVLDIQQMRINAERIAVEDARREFQQLAILN